MLLRNLQLLLVATLMVFAVGCKENKSDPTPVDQTDPEDDPDDDPDDGPDDDETNPITPGDILTNEKYKFLVVEIVSDTGFFTSDRANGNLREFLMARTQKDNVWIRTRPVDLPAKAVVDLNDLKNFEHNNRKKKVDGDTVFIFIACVNSEFVTNPEPDIVFGSAYRSSSIAIFVKKLNQYTLPDMVSRFTLETFTLEHELGHLMGLVDRGTSMVAPHKDPDESHGKHCSNENCLMFWRANENIFLADLLGGSNNPSDDVLPTLDAGCLADLKAAGGK